MSTVQRMRSLLPFLPRIAAWNVCFIFSIILFDESFLLVHGNPFCRGITRGAQCPGPWKDGFTHRPWPRAPCNSFLSRLNTNQKFAKLRRCVTLQFTLKRAEMQMSTVDSYQYSNNNNTTLLCTWAWERCGPSVRKWLQKRMKKKRYLIDVQFSTDKKLLTTQDH